MAEDMQPDGGGHGTGRLAELHARAALWQVMTARSVSGRRGPHPGGSPRQQAGPAHKKESGSGTERVWPENLRPGAHCADGGGDLQAGTVHGETSAVDGRFTLQAEVSLSRVVTMPACPVRLAWSQLIMIARARRRRILMMDARIMHNFCTRRVSQHWTIQLMVCVSLILREGSTGRWMGMSSMYTAAQRCPPETLYSQRSAHMQTAILLPGTTWLRQGAFIQQRLRSRSCGHPCRHVVSVRQ